MGKFLRALKPRRPGIVKRIAYRLGARPHPGSLLYSPSLSWRYAARGISAAWAAMAANDEMRAQAIVGRMHAAMIAEGTTLMFPLAVQTAADREADEAREVVTRESHRDAELDAAFLRSGVDPSHDWERITATRGECNTCGACSCCDRAAYEPCVMTGERP